MKNKRCKLYKFPKINNGSRNHFSNKNLIDKSPETSGITLIALVVTIVILLILSGITIGTLMGDGGIIEKAKEAKKTTIVSVIKEKIDIDKLNKSLGKEDGMITEDELKEILDKYGKIIYDEDEELIEGIIEKDNGYEILLPDIMDGVINQNIYVKLYADGTLAFSHEKNAVLEGKEISKDYGNIKGQSFSMRGELKPGGNPGDAHDFTQITNAPWEQDRNSITNVIFLDEINPSSTAAWFAGCELVTDFRSIQNLNTKYVKNMYGMFASCTSLEDLDLTSLNTGKVETFARMFDSCWNLQNLDVSNFNTSSAINLYRMFYVCEKLTTIDISNFNTSNVIDMSDMFKGSIGLEVLDLSNFNTSNVTNMSGMFYNCPSLTNLDVSSFDTSNVTNMSGMFQSLKLIREIKGLEKFNTSKVTNMSSMFYNCTNITNLDLSNFNTSNVENMSTMFWNCDNLVNLKINNFNTSKVTNMWTMFESCENLTTLDLSSFDTSKVTNMETMFSRM